MKNEKTIGMDHKQPPYSEEYGRYLWQTPWNQKTLSYSEWMKAKENNGIPHSKS